MPNREIILTTDSKDDGDRQWGTILLCLVLVMLHILGSVAYNQAVYTTTTLGLRIKSGLIGLIYRKCLRVSNSFKKNYTIGEIVTMASVDCQRIMDRMMYSYQIICFPFVISLGIFELWVYTGISTLGAIGVMIMVCVLSTIFGKILEKCLQALLHSKGSRIKLITEILNGFKHMKIPLFDNYFMKMTTHQKVVFPRAVIKMFAWEPTFTKKIEDIRNKELRSLKTTASVNALSILVNNQSPFMISYFVFLIYTLTDESKHLDAGTAFLVTSMVNVLRFEIGLIPWNITGFVQIYVSIKRIRKFLCENEMATDNVQYISSGEYAVQIQHGRFTWDKEDSSVTLDGINARITEGKLVAIVGPVGCGKSSLLSAILGEMEKLQGIVFVKGSVAYVPQEAWIQNLTVRENILHDRRYQKRKYDKVVNACALCSDLAILPAGDKTEIGQKGSNLSGGHKQRISTARAVYNNADIYLFDDPLSAVDSNVGKNIFDDVIGNKGMLKNKTRILVTHGIRWLPYVDEVYLMNNGQIVGRGSYKELLKHNASFAQFLKTYLANEYVFKEEFGEESLCDEYLEHIELLTSDGDNSDFERISLRNGNIMEKRISEQGHSRKVVTMTDQSNDWRTTQDESMEEGKVKLSVLWGYMKGMGIKGLIPCLAFLIFNQSLSVYSNFWLTYWTEDGYLNNMSLTSTVGYSERTNYYIIVYSVLGFLQGLFLYLFGIIAMLCVVRAASQLHSGMLKSVMRSPMAFFDTTPTGRIVNRFSSDVDIMDIRMQDTFRGWSITLMTALSTVTAIGVQTPTFLIALVPLAALFAFVLKIYLPTPRQMKRLESVTRSPIYNQINETIAGASIIRAFKSTDAFIADLQKRTDENTRFYHGALLATRWMGVIVDLFGSVLLLVVSLSAALSPGLNGGEVGLSISYGIQIAYTFYYVVDTISEMEINIIASERLFEYAKLESEADWKSVQKPPKTWPSNGEIEFRNYATRYRPGLDLVLRDINCKIYSGEKIGVVGRTGAGKSSITLSLFRLIEGAAGSIIIDGLATSGLGLHDLRRKITILPQDPVLFSGTVRFNLDPDETLSDSDIWKALDCAHLKTFVSKQQEKLGFPVEEFGQNLSVGQRQLVCLGRALLHKNKILILDEATAAVDMETDELIQETIRQEFADCTVLTVAHRLNTIMDYDRIMVMDKGQIVQFDSPKNLLQKKAGMFYAMAKDADLVNWFNFSNQK